jgi:hypothetical protein
MAISPRAALWGEPASASIELQVRKLCCTQPLTGWLRKRVLMRRAMVVILWILVVITAPFYGRAQEFAPAIRPGEHRLPFEARDDLIYIRAVVNGNRTALLVDTGAAFTIFTEKAVPALGADSAVTINMAKGSVLASRLPVGLALGDLDVLEKHCTFR